MTLLDPLRNIKMIDSPGLADFLAKSGQYIIRILPKIFEFSHQNPVPRPRIPIQLHQGLNQTCTKRVQMDIADQFLEINLLPGNNRFVSILEEMTISFMAPIIRLSITF